MHGHCINTHHVHGQWKACGVYVRNGMGARPLIKERHAVSRAVVPRAASRVRSSAFEQEGWQCACLRVAHVVDVSTIDGQVVDVLADEELVEKLAHPQLAVLALEVRRLVLERHPQSRRW